MEQPLVIIVNVNNPVDKLSRAELEKIFLGKRGFWEWGRAIKTADLIEQKTPEEQSSRALFCAEYLGKSLTALKSYWIRAIFSGKGQPPLVFGRWNDVVKYVEDHVEAIGYVRKKDFIPGKTKKITVINKDSS